MDGGAWKAAVRGVAEGRTWLSDFPFTFHFHALEREMAIHSSVLAWGIPGTGEPGGLPSMGSHRVGHDWSDLAVAGELKNVNWRFRRWGDIEVQEWRWDDMEVQEWKLHLILTSSISLCNHPNSHADLSSLTRDWTCAFSSGSMDS